MSSNYPVIRTLPGLALALLTVCLLSGLVEAAESPSRAGHGSLTLAYQRISVDGFEGATGKLPIGTIDTHTLNLEIDYHLTEHWTLVAGIPYVRERYRGPAPHDPLALNPPRPEVRNVDTGAWNSDFQDFHIGVRYLLPGSTLLRVEPFLNLAIPSNDYPFFGHAAIGQNRRKVEPGVALSWSPGLSDAYYRLDVGYVFVQETRSVNIDHWNLRAEAGYFFGRRLTGRLFVLHKDGHGLTFPDDFPDRTSERWFQHDRLIKHNFTNVGAGADWALNDRYSLSSSLMTMTRAEQVHKLEYAYTVSISRDF